MARFRRVLPRQSVLPVVLLALAGAAVGVVSAGPAVAAGLAEVRDGRTTSGTPDPFSTVPAEVRRRMLAQQPLHMAAAEIRSAVEGGHARGFAGIALRVRAHTVEVFWKGALPEAVTEAIARARKTVAVKVTAARYSRAALKRAAEGLVERMRAEPGGPVRSVQIPSDGSGLVVGVDADPESVPMPPGPVRVKVVEQERFKFTSGSSRLADAPPFWGGARIVNQFDKSQCTTGFGVTDANGSKWILTAAHCAAPFDAYFNGNSTWYVGTALYENEYDLMLIYSPNAGGRIWWNPIQGLRVAGSYAPFAGEYVCQSGSVSGPICGLRITGRSFSVSAQDPRCLELHPDQPELCDVIIKDLNTAEAVNGRDAAVDGDSGGPVFVRYFSFHGGEWRILAVGIISGTSAPFGIGPADTLAFQDMGTAYSQWGVHPMFGP
jgi:streptogrisin D